MLKVRIKEFTSTPGTWKFDQQSIVRKVKKLIIFCEIQRCGICAIWTERLQHSLIEQLYKQYQLRFAHIVDCLYFT